MGERAILLIVPGRTDRAFYKVFLIKAFKYNPYIQVIDMDRRDLRERREIVLKRILPFIENSNIVKGLSLLEIKSTKSDRSVYIVIIPSEIQVTMKAKQLLDYFMGLRGVDSLIDTIVVIDDAEDKTFEDKLNSYRDALYPIIIKGKLVKRGCYFELYFFNKPVTFKLLFIVQGLKEVDVVNKHAIEDFVLYLYLEELKSKAYDSCINIFGTPNGKGYHKKLAMLIALSKCYISLEELFFNSMTHEEIDRLKRLHDGLNEIIEATTALVI